LVGIAARKMVQKAADGSGLRRREERLSVQHAAGIDTGHHSRSSRFHIPFNASNLARKEYTRITKELQRGSKHSRRMQKAVAMAASQTNKLCVFQSGDEPKDSFLLIPAHASLKAHQIEQRALFIFGSQLNHGKRRFSAAWVNQTNGFHRPVSKGFFSPACHLFDRKATLKVRRFIEIMAWRLIRLDDFVD